jgi:pimeloyl-ACP methyl ester carboxylesterase
MTKRMDSEGPRIVNTTRCEMPNNARYFFARAVYTLAIVLLGVVPAAASTLGGPLVLQDEGSFFVNGSLETTTYPSPTVMPPGHITVGQMYVHYWIPQRISGPAIIMVHGAVHTGVTYETTPDGREGWATYFVRKGFPVYVVDDPGRGRSGFDATAINEAKAEASIDPLRKTNMLMATREIAWVTFLFGPAFGTAWPDEQFPLQALDQYTAQLVPNTDATVGGGDANTIDALTALVDKIGPAVLLVHSQSGPYGMEVVRRRPAQVRALVNVEGNCTPLAAGDATGAFGKVPYLALWGDHSVGAASLVGDARRNGCMQTVTAIKAENGPATFLLLPDRGIKGNSHMMMMDKNNLQIADIIIDWLATAVKH